MASDELRNKKRTERALAIEAELIRFCCECSRVDCQYGYCDSLAEKRRELKGPYKTRVKKGSEFHGKNPQRFTFRGESLTLSEWGKRLGIDKETLRNRLHKGMSIEKAFLTPVGGLRK